MSRHEAHNPHDNLDRSAAYHVHIAADRVDLAVLQRADQKATLPANAGKDLAIALL